MISRAGAGNALLAAKRMGIWREALRIAVFLAIEGLAEVCRRRLCATLTLPAPRLTSVISAILVLTWAFEAHSRWTFRGLCDAGLTRFAPFLAIGLAGLTSLSAAARVSFEAVLVAWPFVLALKFLLVRAFVWRSPAVAHQAAAA